MWEQQPIMLAFWDAVNRWGRRQEPAGGGGVQRGGRNRRSAQFGAIWSVICQQRVLYTSRVVTTLLYIPLLKGASAKFCFFAGSWAKKHSVGELIYAGSMNEVKRTHDALLAF